MESHTHTQRPINNNNDNNNNDNNELEMMQRRWLNSFIHDNRLDRDEIDRLTTGWLQRYQLDWMFHFIVVVAAQIRNVVVVAAVVATSAIVWGFVTRIISHRCSESVQVSIDDITESEQTRSTDRQTETEEVARCHLARKVGD